MGKSLRHSPSPKRAKSASQLQHGDTAGHIPSSYAAHQVHSHRRGQCGGAIPGRFWG